LNYQRIGWTSAVATALCGPRSLQLWSTNVDAASAQRVLLGETSDEMLNER